MYDIVGIQKLLTGWFEHFEMNGMESLPLRSPQVKKEKDIKTMHTARTPVYSDPGARSARVSFPPLSVNPASFAGRYDMWVVKAEN